MKFATSCGRASLASVFCFVACCSCNSPKKLKYVGKETAPDLKIARENLQPIGKVKSLSNSDQCLYYQEFETGNIMRVSLDGKIRELVIRCGIVRGMELDHALPMGTGPWQVSMPCVPSPGGYSVIDRGVPPPKTATEPLYPRDWIPDDECTVPTIAYITNSKIETRWKFRVHYGKFELEPSHFHSYLDKVEFESGITSRTHDFKDRPLSRSHFPGMVDQTHAVIIDYPNVFVLNLADGAKTCIANTMPGPVVWPRNLYLTERFVPELHVRYKDQNYGWQLHDPDDIYPKPAYRQKPRRLNYGRIENSKGKH